MWRKDGCVGNFVLFHPPHVNGVDFFIEQTIKLRECSPDQAAAVAACLELFDCHRMELFCSNKGLPDRVKITKFGGVG
jgi:hypothetical protein